MTVRRGIRTAVAAVAVAVLLAPSLPPTPPPGTATSPDGTATSSSDNAPPGVSALRGVSAPRGGGAPGGGWVAFPVAAARSLVPLGIGAPADPAPFGGRRCSDPAGAWLDMRWSGRYSWRLDTGSVPGYLRDVDAVRVAVASAAAGVASGRNDCGLPEDLGIGQRYAGSTAVRANVTTDGGCAKRDGRNTVSFGRLTPGLLAVTCVWWEGRKGHGRSVEADILVDEAPGTFFLALPAGCADQWDLEGIVAHEFGHVFGLGHVPYQRHGTLTMSDALPECSTGYRGLGLGDHLVLHDHYNLAHRNNRT